MNTVKDNFYQTWVDFCPKRTAAIKSKWGAIVLFWSIGVAFGQSADNISFQYSNPRNGKLESASTFLNDFALRRANPNSECYYAMGWYRFHVIQTGVIDSISFNGDIHAELKALGEKSIRESQRYWKCSNCANIGGYWFTIPVIVALTTATECNPNPIYRQSVAFWQKLFENQSSDQISIGKNEWLLAPMYAVSMR